MKHQPYDLAQMQSLPLQAKVRMTQQRIRDWYDYWDGNVYVSISGGKDSQVLAHIVKEMYPFVPLVFINTGLEWNSVREKGNDLADVILFPEMNFIQVIKKYGYPIISKEISKRVKEYRNAERKGRLEESLAYKEFNGLLMGVGEYSDKPSLHNKTKWKKLVDAPFRISHQCCLVNKEGVARKFEKETGLKPYVGSMASESRARKKSWIQNGCNAFDGKPPKSNPLSFWTEQDILHYIWENELEIADIYGKLQFVDKDDDGMQYENLYSIKIFDSTCPMELTGEQRTGCTFCLFGIVYDPERLLRLKEKEPTKYDFIMRGGASMMMDTGFQLRL